MRSGSRAQRSSTPLVAHLMRNETQIDNDVVMSDPQSETTNFVGNVDTVSGAINGNHMETAHPVPNGTNSAPPLINMQNRETRQPWEYVEEIVAILKTAFPLLALTLETIQDQLKQRFKPNNDEDNYRILSNAVAAGLSVCTMLLICRFLYQSSAQTLHNGLTHLGIEQNISSQSSEAVETFLSSVTSPVSKVSLPNLYNPYSLAP
jgi:transformation/transcription domain-associated protein